MIGIICCTGLDVVRYGAAILHSGLAEVVVAGGVESMSNAEFYLPGAIKWGIGGQKGMPRGHGDLSIWGLRFYDRIQRARVMSHEKAHQRGIGPLFFERNPSGRDLHLGFLFLPLEGVRPLIAFDPHLVHGH